MSFRSWVYVFAIIGLTFSASSGQTQEKTQRHQGNAQSQQEPTEQSAANPSVNVVSNQAAPDASHRREEEARQREIADLAAQQGMNSATQSMNAATQRMADYSFWSTVLLGVGTALLFYTLWLTRQANKAAQEGVNVTRDMTAHQNRAYISTSSKDAFTRVFFEDSRIICNIVFENVGIVPAQKIEFIGYAVVKGGGADHDFARVDDEHGALAPTASAYIAIELSRSTLERRNQWGDFEVRVSGRFIYENGFSDNCFTSISFSCQGQQESGGANTIEYIKNGNKMT